MANSQLIFDHSALELRVSAWRDKDESFLPEGHLYITPNKVVSRCKNMKGIYEG